MITVDLPSPPSTNRLWRAIGNRVIKSAEYRAWIAEAGLKLNRQNPGEIRGPVELSVLVGKSRRDLSNGIKAVEDLLVAHNVIEGDEQAIVRRIHMALDETVDGCRVIIKPFASDAREAVWG